MTRSRRKSSLAAVAVASMLLAAPTANARLDPGGSGAWAGEAIVPSADSGGFSWGDAAIGAGAALGAVAIGAPPGAPSASMAFRPTPEALDEAGR